MFSTQTNGTVTRLEAMQIWIETIKTIPIMYLSIILAPVTILGAVILERDHKIGRTFFIVSLISSILYVFLIAISARYLIQIGYFAPIYPYFILEFLVLPLYIIRKWNITLVKFVTIASLVYFLFFVLVADFSVSIPKGYTRLMYKETPIYQVYSYIEDNIPPGSKIAHDHLVAIPSDNGFIGCHYWSEGCGTNYIEKFKPDYVIFSENWKFGGETVKQKFGGETVPETLRLEKYVTDHHFILIDTLPYNGKVQISVWKKPDQ
jgi:hypothetical protein